MRVAVIGAGIAGLACARALAKRGAAVTVFEAVPVVGGRLAGSLGDGDAGPVQDLDADSGAQYFTIQQERFRAEVLHWVERGVAARWPGRIVALVDGQAVDKSESAQRWVGVPQMATVAQFLGRGLSLELSVSIQRVRRLDGRWHLFDTASRELGFGFDAVCVATGSPQAAALLHDAPALAARAASVQWDGCWATVLNLTRPSGIDFDGAFVNDDPILGWAARDSGKPGRSVAPGVAERWVLHARPRWSRDYAQLSESDAANWMLRAFSARLGRALAPRSATAYRWLQATPLNPLAEGCLWDPGLRIGAGGDWCGGPRIEAAYLSGLALADAVDG